HLLQSLPDGWVGERFAQFSRELVHDRARRTHRYKKATPKLAIDIGKPGLSHAWDVGQFRRALRTRHRKSADLACLNQRDDRRPVRDCEQALSRDDTEI